MIGGRGNDVLDGGDGQDVFRFMVDDFIAGEKDKILDGKGDSIDLSDVLEFIKINGQSPDADTSLPDAFNNTSGSKSNIAFDFDNEVLWFDLDQNGQFSSSSDFQIDVAGIEKFQFDAGYLLLN